MHLLCGSLRDNVKVKHGGPLLLLKVCGKSNRLNNSFGNYCKWDLISIVFYHEIPFNNMILNTFVDTVNKKVPIHKGAYYA